MLYKYFVNQLIRYKTGFKKEILELQQQDPEDYFIKHDKGYLQACNLILDFLKTKPSKKILENILLS